ncbi:MAG: hypothetical protein ACOX7R_06660 [Acetivibrionales bacterium]|jgi:hypothetical protein
MTKDIYRNKKDFSHEEFATEMLHRPKGSPQPRESRSQKAQYETFGTPGMGRKDKKK